MEQEKHTKLKTITILGTGIMGAAVAKNLQKDGFNVHVWNRTKAKAKKLESLDIHIFDTPQEAVQGTDVIITFLKDGSTVMETMQAVKTELSSDMIWLQMSTVGLYIDKLIEFSDQQNIIFYDVPVQGTKQPAEQGQLVMLPSGPIKYRKEIIPIFSAIGKQTFWISEKVGESSRLKLALNSWVAALTHGVAESLTLAEGLGIDPNWVVEVVSGGPMDNMYFQQKSQAMLEKDFAPSFSAYNALKDTEIVAEAAKEENLQLDIAQAGLKRFERVVNEGHGDKDMAASYLVTEGKISFNKIKK